jgi:hypothetical protein
VCAGYILRGGGAGTRSAVAGAAVPVVVLEPEEKGNVGVTRPNYFFVSLLRNSGSTQTLFT